MLAEEKKVLLNRTQVDLRSNSIFSKMSWARIVLPQWARVIWLPDSGNLIEALHSGHFTICKKYNRV